MDSRKQYRSVRRYDNQGFLLGETNNNNLFKDPAMLKRLNDINNLPEIDKSGILFAIDGLLRDAKTRLAYQ